MYYYFRYDPKNSVLYIFHHYLEKKIKNSCCSRGSTKRNLKINFFDLLKVIKVIVKQCTFDLLTTIKQCAF